jgi:FkbM family methyltransferase
MDIKKIAQAFKEKLLGSTLKTIHVDFHGTKLQLVIGTIRDKVDRDDHWIYLLTKNSEVFFDVGCNMGFVTLTAFLSNSSRNVVLIDANNQALQIAFQNMLLNGFVPRCVFYDGFVAETNNKEQVFYTIGAGAAGSMFKSHAESASVTNSYRTVRTRSIDYIVSDSKQTPDLVKIDVEGAEQFVLRGARELAKLMKTRFFIEMHSNSEMSMMDNANQVLNWCNEVNYKAWYLRDEKELVTPGLISDRGRCHLLLQPSHWPYPIFLTGIKEGSDLPAIL